MIIIMMMSIMMITGMIMMIMTDSPDTQAQWPHAGRAGPAGGLTGCQ